MRLRLAGFAIRTNITPFIHFILMNVGQILTPSPSQLFFALELKEASDTLAEGGFETSTPKLTLD